MADEAPLTRSQGSLDLEAELLKHIEGCSDCQKASSNRRTALDRPCTEAQELHERLVLVAHLDRHQALKRTPPPELLQAVRQHPQIRHPLLEGGA